MICIQLFIIKNDLKYIFKKPFLLKFTKQVCKYIQRYFIYKKYFFIFKVPQNLRIIAIHIATRMIKKIKNKNYVTICKVVTQLKMLFL